MAIPTLAQREANVEAEFTYKVGENQNITIAGARLRAIEGAKAKAITEEFGQMVTSDVVSNQQDFNGKSISYYEENALAMARGTWLASTEETVDVSYDPSSGSLLFNAHVKGKAREIIQSQVDIKWSIFCGERGRNGRKASTTFNNRDRLYVEFVPPADGYAAVYLTVAGSDEVYCLLPYKNSPEGRFSVKNGLKYTFFDKEDENNPAPYNIIMKTEFETELNQVVLIYSPHPFVKCTDVSKGGRNLNSLNSQDFQKWLLKHQRGDADMVVRKQLVTITGQPKSEM